MSLAGGGETGMGVLSTAPHRSQHARLGRQKQATDPRTSVPSITLRLHDQVRPSPWEMDGENHC